MDTPTPRESRESQECNCASFTDSFAKTFHAKDCALAVVESHEAVEELPFDWNTTVTNNVLAAFNKVNEIIRHLKMLKNMSKVAVEEKEWEKMYEWAVPRVDKMRAKYPKDFNMDGMEPALTSDIVDILLEFEHSKFTPLVAQKPSDGLETRAIHTTGEALEIVNTEKQKIETHTQEGWADEINRLTRDFTRVAGTSKSFVRQELERFRNTVSAQEYARGLQEYPVKFTRSEWERYKIAVADKAREAGRLQGVETERQAIWDFINTLERTRKENDIYSYVNVHPLIVFLQERAALQSLKNAPSRDTVYKKEV